MKKPKPHDFKKVPVTKLEAARRQLETAITLWFHDTDPVSVHTLAMAAHGILRALNSKRGGKPMLGDPNPFIPPEFHERFRKIVFEASNFFKHGARDPLTTHFFSPELNKIIFVDATQAYESQAQEQRPLMKMFRLYLAFHEPRLFEQEYLDSLQQNPLFSKFKQLSKQQFFVEFLPYASSIYRKDDFGRG
jgi:hypothetical protein